MPVVTAKGLSIAFGARSILENAALAIDENERVGLVGGNGAGKSTLAKILVGTVTPDAGNVVFPKDAKVAYLAQEVSFPENSTARAYLEAGLQELNQAMEQHSQATAALTSADAPQSKRLLLKQSEAAHRIELLGGWEQGHRVDEIAERLGLSNLDQSVDTMSGGERRRVALARILLAPPDLAVLDEPTNHLDVDTIEWLEEFLTVHYRGALLLITHDRYILDQVVERTLELDHGTVYSYDGGWSQYLAAKSERLAVEKQTEANRQNLLRRELDWLSRSPKARTTKSKSRIQRAENLRENTPKAIAESMKTMEFIATRAGKTILENIADNREKVSFGGKLQDARAYARRFLFSYEKQRQPVFSLSGGERARVALAKFLLEPANVLILDEPTNDLDVDTLSSLEEILIDSGATIFFVTHDRYFLDRVATSVIAFEGNAEVILYEGSYQALLRVREAKEAERKQQAAKAKQSQTAPPRKQAAGLTFTEKHELKELMPKVEAAEAKLASAEAELSDPTLYANRGHEVPALVAAKDSAEVELNALLERWEKLESKKA